jgi:hypothetical protein
MGVGLKGQSKIEIFLEKAKQACALLSFACKFQQPIRFLQELAAVCFWT